VVALGACVEELISVNNHLSLPEAAAGVLEYSGVAQRPELLEKLGRWEKARDMYRALQLELEAAPVKPPARVTASEDGDEDEDEFGDSVSEAVDAEQDLGDSEGGFGGAGIQAAGFHSRAGAVAGAVGSALSAEATRYARWRTSLAEAKLGQLRFEARTWIRPTSPVSIEMMTLRPSLPDLKQVSARARRLRVAVEPKRGAARVLVQH
jgi:hypothetical protein